MSGAGGEGAAGHMRFLQYIHLEFQMMPYFGEEAKRNPGLRLSMWVRVEHANPSGCSQPTSLVRTSPQDPAFELKALRALG